MTNKEVPPPEEPVLPVTLNVDKIRANLPEYTSQKICEMIVVERYFGLGEKVSNFCMEELAKRRIAGDTFDFESYIDTAYKGLPVLDLKKDIREVLKQAMSGKFKK